MLQTIHASIDILKKRIPGTRIRDLPTQKLLTGQISFVRSESLTPKRLHKISPTPMQPCSIISLPLRFQSDTPSTDQIYDAQCSRARRTPYLSCTSMWGPHVFGDNHPHIPLFVSRTLHHARLGSACCPEMDRTIIPYRRT